MMASSSDVTRPKGPRRPCPPGVDLPDDLVAAVAARLSGLEDLQQVMAVDQQWRRVARRPEVMGAHLAQRRPGALEGLGEAALPAEICAQVQVRRNLARGRHWTLDLPLPQGASLFRLGRNRRAGSFLLFQSPLGQINFWPVERPAREAAARRMAPHPTPLTSLGVSDAGDHVVGASSGAVTKDTPGNNGMVQLWRQAPEGDCIVVADRLDAQIFSTAADRTGGCVVAGLRIRDSVEFRLWSLDPAGKISASFALMPHAMAGAGPEGPRARMAGELLPATPLAGWAGGPELRGRRHLAALGADPRADVLGLDLHIREGQAWLTSAVGGPRATQLGERANYRTCLLSACGKMLLSTDVRGGVRLWRFAPPPASSANPLWAERETSAPP